MYKALSKVSIKDPVLLNDQYNLKKIDRTILFTYLLTVSIKYPGLDIWKQFLLSDQYYIYILEI